ncbi:MAG TPA: hypothetical protein VGH97_14455 [Thermoanaerobaculia bacterium]
MEALPGFAIEALLEGRNLRQQIAGKPAAAALLSGLGARLTRASDLASPSATRDPIATTVPGLDRLLRGGLPRGGFVELSGKRSSGRFSIGLAALASATSSGEAAALVDLGGHLDPQSAEAAGADLTRLLWVRPSRLKEAVASAEMLLATGFPLVVADLGLAPVRGRFVPDAAWVRLERAARAHHAALLLLAPYRISGVAAEAVVAADSARGTWSGSGSSPRLLAGLASRLTLQKDARARTGVSEAMRLSMGDVPLSHPSPSGPAGGRGDFLPSLDEAVILSGAKDPARKSHSAVSDGILRRSPSLRSGFAPQDDGSGFAPQDDGQK